MATVARDRLSIARLPARHKDGWRLAVGLSRAVGALVMTWLLTAGILLAVRTLAYSLRPLAFGQLVLAAVALAATAWLTRAAWSVARRTPSGKLLPVLVTSFGLTIWGASLTWPSGSPAAALFFWLIVGAEESWAWRKVLARGRGLHVESPAATTSGNRVLQQFTRVLAPNGEETIHGSIAITVERGGRSAAGHVSFCPPFAERPQFEMKATGKTNVALKLSQIFPHGARIELKLAQPAQGDTIVSVEFVARARSDRENGPLAL